MHMQQIFKKAVSVILSVICAGGMMTVPVFAKALPEMGNVAREAAEEGIVLLKNDNHMLPVKPNEIVSVFGRVQVDTFTSGYGSGSGDKAPYNISILEGMKKNQHINVNTELADVYERWCKANPANQGSWGNWPFYYPEMPVSKKLVTNAREKSDKAIIVIGRAAGEDRECKLEAGSYYLTDEEKKMLVTVCSAFDKVAVLMNAGNIMDMSWVDDYNISSVMYVWQGGMETGNAVADIISGIQAPSGKLSSTIAKKYTDYPSAGNFGGTEYNNYSEDIYVGYRYFETFAQDRVMYPFGYGLSYTEFEITPTVTITESTIKITASVKNIGAYSGKEVVEVYYGAPAGTLGKSARSLAAYAKTDILMPGHIQVMELSFPIDNMASYDDSGASGHKSAWILEKGEYPIYVGNSVRIDECSGIYRCESTKIVKQLQEANAPTGNAFLRTKAAEENGKIVQKTESVPLSTVNLKDRIERNLPESITMTGDRGIKLIDVYNGGKTMDEFVAQLSATELEAILRGDYTKSSSLGITGNASVYGGTIPSLRDKGIPAISTVDGPAGINAGTQASVIPIGTMLACTWNKVLVEKVHNIIGNEMCENGADVLLAPGMNIQRNPLCGRNFEYYSEDPVLTGSIAAAAVKGIQKAGCSATPKHFALNNQEVSRRENDSRCSERAQREIYLKGFEICVKESNPYNLMGSYNKVNGQYAYYNYDMCSTILRDEWGYKGCLMTDWWLKADESEELSVKNNAYRVRAQMDVNMPGQGPGEIYDASLLNSYNQWVASGTPKGTAEYGITLGEMQRSAKNVLNYVIHSRTFRNINNLENTYKEGTEYFTTNASPWKDKPQLVSLTISDMDFVAFNPGVTEYNVFLKDMEAIPTVSAAANGNAEVQITQASHENPVAVVRLIENGAQNVYYVIFTNKAGFEPVVSEPKYAGALDMKINNNTLAGFYPTVYEYQVLGDVKTAVVEPVVGAGVEYHIIKDYEKNAITVRTETNDQAIEYKILFVDMMSDSFSDNNIGTHWHILNQNNNIQAKDGALYINTEDGEWYGSKSFMNNVIYQNVTGDWTAAVKMTIPGAKDMIKKSNYQFGIVVFDDPDNYADMNYCSVDYVSDGQILQVRSETDAKCNDKITDSAKQLLPKNEGWVSMSEAVCELRVEKTGNLYTFKIKTPKSGGFVSMGTVTREFNSPKLGLYAANGYHSLPSVEVKFDDFVFSNISVVGVAEDIETINISPDGATKIWAVDSCDRSSMLREEVCVDTDTKGYNLGNTEAGCYALYRINVDKSGYFDIRTRAASGLDNKLAQLNHSVEIDGKPVGLFSPNPTGGWQKWVTTSANHTYITAGSHIVRVVWQSQINLNYISITEQRFSEAQNSLKDAILAAYGIDRDLYTNESCVNMIDKLTTAVAAYENISENAEILENQRDALKNALDLLVRR